MVVSKIAQNIERALAALELSYKFNPDTGRFTVGGFSCGGKNFDVTIGTGSGRFDIIYNFSGFDVGNSALVYYLTYFANLFNRKYDFLKLVFDVEKGSWNFQSVNYADSVSQQNFSDLFTKTFNIVAVFSSSVTEIIENNADPIDEFSEVTRTVIPDISPKTRQNVTNSILTSDIIIAPAVGSILDFGKYKWQVLDVAAGKMLLISKDIIKKAEFGSTSGFNWENSTLNTWLNNDFYNSFSFEEKEKITKENVALKGNIWYNIPQNTSVRCKFFLLNIEEILQYFGDNSADYQNKNRKSAKGEEKFDGGYIYNNFNGSRMANYENNSDWWWVLTGGSCENFAVRVMPNGSIHMAGTGISSLGGVRPVFWMNL